MKEKLTLRKIYDRLANIAETLTSGDNVTVTLTRADAPIIGAVLMFLGEFCSPTKNQ